MTTWKYNDILVRGEEKRRIVGVCDEVIFLEDSGLCSTQKGLEEAGWGLEEVKGEPKEREKYYYSDIAIEKLYSVEHWINDSTDCLRKEKGIIFKTKEEAIAKSKMMLGIK